MKKSKIYLLSAFLFAIIAICASYVVLPAYADETPITETNLFSGNRGATKVSTAHSFVESAQIDENNVGITFLVHGQGGDASNWAQNNGLLSYDIDSLPEKLRNYFDADNQNDIVSPPYTGQ